MTMQAARIHAFGGPELLALESVPAPEPADDELLVKVRAASLNPVDYKTRQGHFPPVTQDHLPLTLGRDIAGTVAVAGGRAGGFRVGDAIMALLTPDHGGFAEYALVRPAQAAIKPDKLSFTEAAALPLAGLTAWQGLFDQGRLQSGQRVLIHGAAGGVGHLAAQFAKQAGAFVFATVATADLAFAAELGIDRPIDFQTERFEDVASELDLVLDLIGGETQARSVACLRRGGALISTLTEPPPEVCAEAGIRGARFLAEPNGAQLAEIGRLADEARVRVRIAETLPFARIGAAMERLEHGGLRGKLVLEIA